MANPFSDNPFEQANPFSSSSSNSGGYGSAANTDASQTAYVPPDVNSGGAKAGYDITASSALISDDIQPTHVAAPSPAPAPAAGSAFNDPVPVATSADVFQAPGDAALSRKEAELAAREEALEREKVRTMKNWPPCYPIARNYITEEIPAAHRLTVRLGYVTFLVDILALFYNAIAIMVFFFGYKGDGGPFGIPTLLGFLYLIVGVPFGWAWYKALYSGCKDDSSKSFVCYFINVGIHFLFTVVAFLGAPGTGMSGLMLTVSASKSSNSWMFMALVGTLLFGADLILSIILIRKSHTDYRHRGVEGFHQIRDDAAQAAVSSAADAAWAQAQKK